jgi:hypothetical protein
MKLTLLCVPSQFVNAAVHFVEVKYVNQSNLIHRAHTLCDQHVHDIHVYLE